MQIVKLVLVIIFLATGLLKATELSVQVIEVESKTGVIYLSICNKESYATKNHSKDCVATLSQQLNGKEEYTFIFSDIPEGEIAIFGFIDENGNGILDETDMRLPKEPVVFAVQLKGFPDFDYIKSAIKGEKQTVKLITQ